MIDLDALDIGTAAALLRARRVSSSDLARLCLERVERVAPALNVFVTVTADLALAQAREADDAIAAGAWRGPLHGVPVSLKDLIDQQGIVTSAGSRVRGGAPPAAADAPVTAALRRAGAVLIGKCNLHEFAFGTTSDESAFGPVRHPLDPSRMAGGSSGGSAVAVATAMSLASIGTDTGGSVRIPAAACGIVGLKAGLGEISCEGVIPLSRSFDHVGPLARTVADAAILYAVLTGTRPVEASEARDPRELRLGVLHPYFLDRLEPPVRRAFDHAVMELRHAGATINPVGLPHADAVPAVYLGITLPEAAAYHAATLDSVPQLYCPGVRARLEAARYLPAEDYVRARRGQQVLRDEVDRALEGLDALLTPTLAVEAPPVGSATVAIDGRDEPVRPLMLRLTQPFNITGHPAISIPAGSTPGGLPRGLQIVGHRSRTPDLLRVALACERYGTRGGTG